MGFSLSTLVSVDLGQLVFGLLCLGDFMGVASDIAKRYNLTENSLILWILYPLSLPHLL